MTINPGGSGCYLKFVISVAVVIKDTRIVTFQGSLSERRCDEKHQHLQCRCQEGRRKAQSIGIIIIIIID